MVECGIDVDGTSAESLVTGPVDCGGSMLCEGMGGRIMRARGTTGGRDLFTSGVGETGLLLPGGMKPVGDASVCDAAPEGGAVGKVVPASGSADPGNDNVSLSRSTMAMGGNRSEN